MVTVTGFLTFPPDDRALVLEQLRLVSARSRQDPGCIDYWWAEDVEVTNRFRFFECWESQELFDAHRSQPYEADFDRVVVSRITDTDAHAYSVTERRSLLG